MNRSPMKAIHAFCLNCCGGSSNEVNLCVSKNCAPYPFRFGKNPNHNRTLSPAQLAALEKGRVPFQPGSLSTD